MIEFNRNIEDRTFLIVVIATIFNFIPEFLRLSFLGGRYASHLSFYFLILLSFISFKRLQLNYSYKEDGRNLLVFSFIYLIIVVSGTILGGINFSCYELLKPQLADDNFIKISLVKYIKLILSTSDNNIDVKILYFFRNLKGAIQELILGFGVSFIIYLFTKRDIKLYSELYAKGILITTIIVVIYGIIDALSMLGSNISMYIIKFVNPLIHSIRESGTWWPPLFWGSFQIRSVFAEPSFFGIYLANAVPVIWYYTKLNETRKCALLYILGSFLFLLTFLTQARTSIFILLIIFLIEGAIVLLNERIYLKKYLLLMSAAIISFILATIVISYQVNMVNNYQLKTNFSSSIEATYKAATQEYLDKNIVSIKKAEVRKNGGERSNIARFAVAEAGILTFFENPWFGVGYGYKDGYFKNFLENTYPDDFEINDWIENIKEKGLLNSGIPALLEFTNRLAQMGILGMSSFFIIPLFIIYQLIRKKAFSEGNENQQLILVILVSTLITGLSAELNIFYNYWIILGLGLAWTRNKSHF